MKSFQSAGRQRNRILHSLSVNLMCLEINALCHMLPTVLSGKVVQVFVGTLYRDGGIN